MSLRGTEWLRGEAAANPKRFRTSFGTGSAISCNDSAQDCFAAARNDSKYARNDNKPVNVLMKRYTSILQIARAKFPIKCLSIFKSHHMPQEENFKIISKQTTKTIKFFYIIYLSSVNNFVVLIPAFLYSNTLEL